MLIINTCKKGFEISIRNVLGNLITKKIQTQSTIESLHQEIKNLIIETNQDFKLIKDIAIAIGPGSFTGIRAGIATAQGITLAIPSINIIPINLMQMGCFIIKQSVEIDKYNIYMQENNDFCYIQSFDGALAAISNIKRLKIKEIKNCNNKSNYGDLESQNIKIKFNNNNIMLFAEYCKKTNFITNNLAPLYAY